MRLTCTALAVLALTGCTSFRADPENLKPIPPDRLLGWQQPEDGFSELVVDRDIGVMGGGCYVAFMIDRQVAARIAVGEAASFHVPAGEHIVGITTDAQGELFCSKGRLQRELRIDAAPGQRQHLRIVSEAKSGFGIRLEPR